MAARNRTARKEDSREECIDLREIDREATNVKIKGATDEDMMILNVERSGSTWTKTAAYEAGQTETDLCDICGKKAGPGHIWLCEALKEDRDNADKELAALDPKHLHSSCRHGIAPVMSARLKGSYWGSNLEGMASSEKKLLGYVPEGLTPTRIREIMERCEAGHTAREVTQHYTSSWGSQKMPLPKKLDENAEAPFHINNDSDGSLKNPMGNHWAIGGVGIWWPSRKIEEKQLNKE